MPEDIAHSSRIINDERPYSIRSSIDVPDVTKESMLTSQRHRPPLQVMDRCSGANEHERSSSSVFTANSTPQEWSLVSNDSLFSLQEDHVCYGDLITGAISSESSDFSLSGDVMSDRPSMVAQQETAGAFDRDGEEARPSIDDTCAREFTVQKTHDLIDANARIPEMSWGFCKSKARSQSQPLPSLVIEKPEKPSSSGQKRSCSLCSCATLSRFCLSSSFSCKMPTCFSCCFNNCTDWSCCCCFPKGSCCQNCANGCWNWSCWRFFGCWNWNCCFKGSCCQRWSCCSCCNSWSCFSKGSCCKHWRCSTGACLCIRFSCL